MRARRSVFIVLVSAIAAIFSVAFVANAQQVTPKTCPVVVSDSLTALGTNCANLSRNTSCYGHDQVQHTFPNDFYTKPGDRADLGSTVITVQTGPFNLDKEFWGLNVMNVNANLPYAVSPKGVIYVQFGGVEVESGVPAAQAVKLPETGINVSTTAQTDLLTWPAPSIDGHASETIMSVPSGSDLSVDAIDPTGKFVRAVYQSKVGWVSASALDSSVDLTSLVKIGPDDMTPMQSFYMRTGIDNGDPGALCAQAPSLLFVQGPNNNPVDIKVFNQPVRIESTIILRTLPPGDTLGTTLELITLTGLAVVNPDTGEQVIIPPGFKSTIPLCQDFVSLGTEGDADEKAVCGKWSTPVQLTQDELNELDPVQDIPTNITNYGITIPILIQASGLGTVSAELYFPNQAALDAAKLACTKGELSPDICQYLGITA